MSDNPQYDHLLGGNQELPSSIRLINFAAARCKEIQTMRQSLSSSKGTKLVFQKLPIHMRRRVMSHNAKRLPRRLREIHLNQLKKSGLGVKQKKPPRKYRRRPQNLLADYVRRQKKHKWLETHIWHAKRFHMVERWNYKLPQSPCDKAFRACYRATAKHCLLEDVSYTGCIEINGQEECIIENFSKICDRNVNNLSIGAKSFINGNREGKLTLFSDSVPLGDINFHWIPRNDGCLNRTLWIWVHAAFFDAVLNTLVAVFDLKIEKDLNLENFYKNDKTNTSLYDLRFDLNRFRLTGPLSHAILQDSFTFSGIHDSQLDLLVKTFLNNEPFKNMCTNQMNYWKSIKNISSAGELSPHIILGLTALDLRYNLPKKRTKALSDNSEIPPQTVIETFPKNLSWSPIFDKTIRKFVKENKISNFELCEMRRTLLVPGTELDSGKSLVPYLLIHRPGNKNDNIGYCSGWDLIVPSGWAQPTWLALIMRGARAGGLREAESNLFEMGLPAFLKPDTQSGIEEDKRISQLHRHRYFSLPPNKRVNYNKLSIVSPFECKWKVLLKDWNCFSDEMAQFFVLRDKKLLQLIQDNITKKTIINKLDINFQKPYIVPVRLILHRKGLPRQYSIICLPKPEDLRQPHKETIETPKADCHQAERTRLRHTHKKLIKKLSRYRKRCRLTGKTFIQKSSILDEYKKKMSDLWLPDVQSQIRTSCSREIIGWITKGDFSFTIGKSAAVGYVVMGSLPELFSSSAKNKVLVRSTSSRQYRIATMEIVL